MNRKGCDDVNYHFHGFEKDLSQIFRENDDNYHFLGFEKNLIEISNVNDENFLHDISKTTWILFWLYCVVYLTAVPALSSVWRVTAEMSPSGLARVWYSDSCPLGPTTIGQPTAMRPWTTYGRGCLGPWWVLGDVSWALLLGWLFLVSVQWPFVIIVAHGQWCLWPNHYNLLVFISISSPCLFNVVTIRIPIPMFKLLFLLICFYALIPSFCKYHWNYVIVCAVLLSLASPSKV